MSEFEYTEFFKFSKLAVSSAMVLESLPIIDLALAKDPATKPQLLEDLKNALFRIGFMYIINHGVEKEARAIMDIAPKAFDVPEEEKLKISMTKNPHFVGYSELGDETTAKKTDLREQYDFGSVKTLDADFDDPNRPLYKKLRGPSEYLPDSVLPGFKNTVQSYIDAMSAMSADLIHLISESLNLPPDSLDSFIGQMHRLKIVKYPPATPENDQGVGPHKDSSGLLTFVLQDNVGGLQVLDHDGEWVDATPIKDSFVVNIAQGFEALTGGRCGATTHRVISPKTGVTRYSIPYFEGVRLDLTIKDIRQHTALIQDRIPEPNDFKKRNVDVASEFINPKYSCFGEAHLRNRVRSHQDVSRIWYKEVFDKYINDDE